MFEIKPYGEDMKRELFELTAKCFEQCGKVFEPDGRHAFYNDIPHNFVQLWCMFDGETMIGTVGLKRLSDDSCELKALYLEQKYQGRGLGRRLAQTAIDFARKKGYAEMYLDCMSSSVNAVALYERLGFHKAAKYNKNNFADIFMKMSLQQPQTL